MKSSRRLSLLSLLAAFAGGSAVAQDGFLAGSSAFAPESSSAFEVNTRAYDELFEGAGGGNWFGTWEEQIFRLSAQFNSETVIWGTKVSQQSFTPRIDWISPMFGGESYFSVSGITPLDRADADQLWINTGWKYRIFSSLDIDIGGNTVFFSRRVAGPGVVATNYGHRYRNDVYLGLIARVLLEPSLYVSYDTELQQLLVQGGVNYSLPIGSYFSMDGLSLDMTARVGYLNANKWLARSVAFTGQNYTPTYFFGEVKADLVYRIGDGLKLNAGVRYAGNTEGTGASGFPGLSLGPDNMVWFGAGVGYEF